MRKVIRGRVDPEEVDLLYRIYDRNADGAIWVGEPLAFVIVGCLSLSLCISL